MRFKFKSAFTFPEAIAVTVIITALVAALFPASSKLIKLKKGADTRKVLKEVEWGLRYYFEDVGEFPSDLTYLWYNPFPGETTWQGPYIDFPPPYEDGWGRVFVYPQPWTLRAAVISRGRNGSDESSAGWSDPDTFTFQGDDIGIVVAGKLTEYNKVLETKKRLLEIVELLEEYFDEKCNTIPSDIVTLSFTPLSYPNPLSNYFPRYLTEVMPPSLTLDAWGNPISYLGCVPGCDPLDDPTDGPDPDCDEWNPWTCDDWDSPNDITDPAFEARVWTYQGGVTYEAFAIGFCRAEEREDFGTTYGLVRLGSTGDYSEADVWLPPSSTPSGFAKANRCMGFFYRLFPGVVTYPLGCFKALEFDFGGVGAGGPPGAVCAIFGRISGGTYVSAYE